LTFVDEQYHQGWAAELKALLREMKTAAEWARASGLRHLPAAAREAFITRSQALLATEHAAHPPPARRPRQRGRVKQTPAQNLLERLWLGEDQVLGIWAFLDDCTIPFDNNQAERDVRMLKVQRRCRAPSAQTTAPTHSLACAGTFPPSENKGWRCSPPSRPSSPASHSTRPSPE
jgi:transposase